MLAAKVGTAMAGESGMRPLVLVVGFVCLSACGDSSSNSLNDESLAAKAVAESTSTTTPTEEPQPNRGGATSTSTEKPIALLGSDELEAVEELSNEILLTYFYTTREGGDIHFWSVPQRREFIRSGAQYGRSTETIYMYHSPNSILRVEDNRIIWKDSSDITRITLGKPITFDVYSFALKEPVAQSQALIVDGIKREAVLHSTTIGERGRPCRWGEAIVIIMEGTTAPDGSRLHEILCSH